METIRGYAPDANLQTVMDAYLLAARAHQGQMRKSGEPYLSHPLAVAQILADMGMDIDTVATALLHDALEDNPITKEEMTREIGPVITELVDGVTKIGKLKFRSKEELAAENFRKMMLAMSRDLRVILVKLADRLHNMSTLHHHGKPEKQARIAKETMEIFVPIANRLGLSNLKCELEDYCFRYLHPPEYQEITQYLTTTQDNREGYTARVVDALKSKMADWKIECDVSGRAKHRFSIYRKMQAQGLALTEVSDLLAFRVLVHSVADCYLVLGQIHSQFPPVPDRIKDYVARPKPNGYQSLHTTVIGPEGRKVEIQIRTHEMHNVAEQGIAAHWQYKEGHLAISPEEVIRISKIRDLFETARDTENAEEFMESVKVEFYANEVFVFTPRGDIKRFPMGATAIDFAYAVHTDVGNRCTGAKADGRMVPLRYELQSGDHMEVLTSPTQTPNRDWLQIAKTGRAIQKIRRYLREQETEQGGRLGREMIESELKRFSSNMQKISSEGGIKAILKKRDVEHISEIYVDVARGALPLQKVVRDLLPEGVYQTRLEESQSGALSSLLNRFRPRSESPVLITGEDGVLVSYAKCCAPLPGEAVVGFITRGRGITVHRNTCRQLRDLEADRRIPVQWAGDSNTRHSGEIHIYCNDRPGMLANISKVCEQNQVNIQRVDAKGINEGSRAVCTLAVEVRDVNELSRLIRNIEQIKGVDSVERTLG